MRMEPNSLSDEQKKTRYIMNTADNQNSTYRRIIMVSKTSDDSSLSHTKWNCKYHIVFIPKYRRKAIYVKLITDIGQILRQLCDYKNVEIIEAHAMPDPIHMLLKIPPKISVSGLIGYLKGKSALMIFERYANLKYRYGNRHFWAKGFFCKHSRVKYKSGRGLYKKPRKRSYGSR